MKPINTYRLARPADAFLPAALLAASLLGRDAIAADCFLALLLTRLCALSASTGLRAAFAVQPSMRYAQGSVCAALLTQLLGAVIALPIFPASHPHRLALVAFGGLLNIEHIFYEYMVAEGDGSSATLSRGIAAALVLTGLLLGCPPGQGAENPRVYSVLYPLATAGLSALVGLSISLSMGGRLRPKMNAQVFRAAPLALLQSALYPGLAWLILRFSGLKAQTHLSLFAGLILYELCRTPFRRTREEAKPLNRALLIVGIVCVLGILPFALGYNFPGGNPLLHDMPYVLGGVMLAAACVIVLYSNL